MNQKNIEQAMRIIGGRRCTTPEHLHRRMNSAFGGAGLSRHFFSFRVAGELVVWFEVWCNNEGVIADKNKIALEVASLGFRIAFLPTYLSVREIGQRRPCLVTPVETKLDLKMIANQLEATRHLGVTKEQTR